MTPDETKAHNAAILSNLDLDVQLAAYRAEERASGRRGSLFVELGCLMVDLQHTTDQTFSQKWILENIGTPDRQHDDSDSGEIMLCYKMSLPDCDWSAFRMTNGTLTAFRTWEKTANTNLEHISDSADAV